MRRIFAQRGLNLILLVILLIAVLAVIFAHEKPFARQLVCPYVGICPEFKDGDAINKIIYDLAIGAITSLMFYFLLVKVPELHKRQRTMRSLEFHYINFKKDVIATIVGVTDGSYNMQKVESLLNQNNFRSYFEEMIDSDPTRWDRFLNRAQEHQINDIIIAMQIFRAEISYTLQTVDVTDKKPFEFLKSLSAIIYRFKEVKTDYDEMKSFSRFLWSMFAGWDFVTGYQERDVIKDMINSI